MGPVDSRMPSLASAPLRPSPLRLAWRHLNYKRGSAASVAVALVLALLPGTPLFIASLSDVPDVQAVVRASDGVTVDRSNVADARSFDAFQRDVQEHVDPHLGRYLGRGSERATAGPFRIVSINGREPAAPVAAAAVTGAYVSDLSARVDVVQGVLSSPRLAGVEPTVTMPQAAADRANIRESDILCVGPQSPPGPGLSPWCARLIGLWVSTGVAGVSSSAQNQQLQLFAGREEFFALAGMKPSEISASRQYGPQAVAVAPQDLTTVAEGVRQLRASVGAAHVGQVQTSLDADLQRYAASRRMIDFPIRLLTAALALLSVLLVGVLGRWYLGQRLSDLELLRARGWPQTRARRVVLSQFALLAVPALAIGAVGLSLTGWLAQRGSHASVPAIDLTVFIAATCIPFVAAGAGLTWIGWHPSQEDQLGREPRKAAVSPALPWRDRDISGFLVLPAAVLLLLPRLGVADGWWFMGIRLDLGPVLASLASLTGLVLLVVATLPVGSLAVESISRRRDDLEGTLAQWQLRRWWQRYAAAGSVIVLGFAIATFAAVELALVQLGHPGAGFPGPGVALSLAIGFSGALVSALLAYGLTFVFASRSRGDDYAALLVDGLQAASLRRSLGIEQHTVLAVGLLIGVGLGLVLVGADSPGLGLEGRQLSPLVPAVVGAISTASLGLILGVAVAWLARRSAVSFELVEQLWRLR